MSNVKAIPWLVREPCRISLLAGGGAVVGVAVGRGVGRAVGRGVGRGVGFSVGREVGRAVGSADAVTVGNGVGGSTADGQGAACDGEALHPDDGVDAGVGETCDASGDREAGAPGPQPATTSVTASVSHARERFTKRYRAITTVASA
jgi:hypothetical protein